MALGDRIRARLSNMVERLDRLRGLLDGLDLDDLKLLLPLVRLLLEEEAKAEETDQQ